MEELLAGAGEIFRADGETFGILGQCRYCFPTVHDDEGNEVQLTHGNHISSSGIEDRTVRQGSL